MKPALKKQLDFIRAIDPLKSVLRRTFLMDGSRRENSAEHSWHLAVMAIVLAGHSRRKVDAAKCVRMALVHDIPEALAGDSFLYDAERRKRGQARERRAAKRLFGRLPRRQCAELLSAWREFEAGKTPEALFVRALDRLEPIMCNYATKGRLWRENGVREAQVRGLNMARMGAAPALGRFVDGLLREAVRRKYLAR